MKEIPIFVSCPTDLSDVQAERREVIMKEIENLQLEPRALGRSDYPDELPLREVAIIAKHCSGGVILGFRQFETFSGKWKPDTDKEKEVDSKEGAYFPTPWNQLESGILFGMKLPLLIFREEGISGGVFDNGVTDVFVHKLPPTKPNKAELKALKQVFLKWHSKVSQHYHSF